MDLIIRNGRSGGFWAAEVNQEGALFTNSIAIPQVAYESERHGDVFVVSTGFVALTTTASFNGVVYIKNEDLQNRPVYLERLRVCGGVTTMGNTMQCIIYKNPTGGTLISDANPGFVENFNTTSSEEFSGLVYAASGDGKTVTGGRHWSNFQGGAPGHIPQPYNGALILGKNDSMAIALKPTAAMEVCMELTFFFK